MNIPPLAAIRAFESAARHLSFTRAADELGMTQAGVSYQIKLLEERLGAALFLRKPRALELTALGARLAGPTSQAFDLLRAAYADPLGRATTLSVTTPVTLSGNWLAERMGRFQMEHPDLTLRLDASDRLIDFNREDFDIAIRHGDGNWPGLATHRLFDYEVTPMLSPTLLPDGPLTRPEQLHDLPWIDTQDPNWALWMQQAGVAGCICHERHTPDLGTQIHEARAAIAGQGVAMLTPRFFRYELATGSLVQPFPLTATNGLAYWLAYPESRRSRPAIRAFRQFILAEAEKS
ncbi:LysR family transcriptional regulator [Paracoccus sp. M683]|uniref:LysR substrate-binding domain-containing protein n=1 Tax=Paracoccus sp. M683 TaxID=2594268 RepID=UPI00117C0036|nr:LysR substrate-binding domain-containing protein [Paracoccus sp. M683]TRW98411.1 LysR family transcriptional regulator [Paracoccus sp. M683]